MRIRLLKEAKIRHKEGDIVEVSPSEADFLIVNGVAKPVAVPVVVEEKKRTTKKEK